MKYYGIQPSNLSSDSSKNQKQLNRRLDNIQLDNAVSVKISWSTTLTPEDLSALRNIYKRDFELFNCVNDSNVAYDYKNKLYI